MFAGSHAFIVCTHVDKHHIHNHIYWNSTSLDCTRKFRNFWGSTMAVRRLSDLICVEHQMSIIENPKPHGLNYNRWQSDVEKLSNRDRLCFDMDEALSKNRMILRASFLLWNRLDTRSLLGRISLFITPDRKRIFVCALYRRNIERMQSELFCLVSESIIQGNGTILWQHRERSWSLIWKQRRIKVAVVTMICLFRIKLQNSRQKHFCIINSMVLALSMIFLRFANLWKK